MKLNGNATAAVPTASMSRFGFIESKLHGPSGQCHIPCKLMDGFDLSNGGGCCFALTVAEGGAELVYEAHWKGASCAGFGTYVAIVSVSRHRILPVGKIRLARLARGSGGRRSWLVWAQRRALFLDFMSSRVLRSDYKHLGTGDWTCFQVNERGVGLCQRIFLNV